MRASASLGVTCYGFHGQPCVMLSILPKHAVSAKYCMPARSFPPGLCIFVPVEVVVLGKRCVTVIGGKKISHGFAPLCTVMSTLEVVEVMYMHLVNIEYKTVGHSRKTVYNLWDSLKNSQSNDSYSLLYN